jgi:hypothetical protein
MGTARHLRRLGSNPWKLEPSLSLRPYRTLPPPHCASCGKDNALRLDPWHHLSCDAHRGREITLRHNAVVQALFHHADHAGAAACKEPQGYSSEDGRRPDLHIVIPRASLLTDVVVSHPLAPSHIATAATRTLAVAKRAAAFKTSKYKQLAAAQSTTFIPFAVETTGGISSDALKVIEQLSLASQEHLTLPSRHPFANDVLSSIAIAIQRGNAAAIYAGYTRAVMKAGRGAQRAA